MSIAPACFSRPSPPAMTRILLLALARIQMADAGGDPRTALMRLLTVAPDRHAAALRLCEEVAAAGAVDSAYHGVDVLTDVALLEGDFDRTIDTLRAFLGHAAHTPALVKLVEVCVDAGRSEPMREAQAGLADKYLETGHAVEARVIAEDLLAADPQSGSMRSGCAVRSRCWASRTSTPPSRGVLPTEAGSDIEELDLSTFETPRALRRGFRLIPRLRHVRCGFRLQPEG